jgi:hypothetical protein
LLKESEPLSDEDSGTRFAGRSRDRIQRWGLPFVDDDPQPLGLQLA